MSRRLSLIVTLGVVVVAIAAYIIVRNLPEKPFEPVQRERYTHLNVRSSDLTRIDMERDGRERLTLERIEVEIDGETDSIWSVANPEISFEPQQSAMSDIAFTMSNLYSEHLVEENPSDLSPYGLDDPNAVLEVETNEGEAVRVTIGSLSPTGVTYYVQIDDDQTVYTMRKYTVDKVFTDVVAFRDKTIRIPDTQQFTYLRVENDRTIEVVPNQGTAETLFAAPGTYVLAKPYQRRRTISAEKFQEFIESIPGAFTVAQFVADNPDDLSLYGLDDPRYEFELRDPESSITLLFGDEANEDEAYVKYADQPGVFTLPKRAIQFLQVDPFTIADKFMLLVNIQYVDGFTIEGFGERHYASIDRTNYDEEKDEGAVYYLDEVEVPEDAFKKYYQKVIGLLADSEHPDPQPFVRADVTVAFDLNEKVPLASARLDLTEFDRNFYAAYHDGVTEFLVSDYQVEDMFDGAKLLLETAETDS